MKRLMGKILSLVLVFTFVFSFGSGFVYAQTTTPPPSPTLSPVEDQGPAAPQTTLPSTSKVTPCDDKSFAIEIACYIPYYMTQATISVFGLFTLLAAKLLDVAVNNFILDIKSLFLTETGTDKAAIYNAWRVIRDLCNVAAFFGAIYMGFRRMVGLDQDDFKKAIAKLAMFAILTNFSFPISKFVIDISNIVSLQAYGGIAKYDFSSSGGISNSFINRLGLSFLATEQGKLNDSAFTGFNSFAVMALFVLFLILAFFVFLYAALMILIRAAMLLLSVVLSPLMFIGGLVPSLSGLHDWWRQNFIGQLVFGPIFMTMLWIAFQLLNAATTVTSLSSVTGSIDGTISTGVATQIANMSMSIIFLVVAVYLSNKFSGSVGKFVGGAISGVVSTVAIGAATGGLGLAGRAALGRAGVAMQRSGWVQNKIQNGGAITRNTARLIDYSGKRAQNAKVFGSSYRDKVIEKKSAVREGFAGTLRGNAGLQDQLGQAKTKGEVEKVQNQLRAGNANTATAQASTANTVPVDPTAGLNKTTQPSSQNITAQNPIQIAAQQDRQGKETKNATENQILKDNNVSATNSARYLELEKQKVSQVEQALKTDVEIEQKKKELDVEMRRAVMRAMQSGVSGDAVENIRTEYKERVSRLDQTKTQNRSNLQNIRIESDSLKNTIGVAPAQTSTTSTAQNNTSINTPNTTTPAPVTPPTQPTNNQAATNPRPTPISVQPVKSKMQGVRDTIGNAALKTVMAASKKVGEKIPNADGVIINQIAERGVVGAVSSATSLRQKLKKYNTSGTLSSKSV